MGIAKTLCWSGNMLATVALRCIRSEQTKEKLESPFRDFLVERVLVETRTRF
jgi:hypothetical protein